MRTFLFKEYLDSENGRFFPVETYNSEEFGRTFMIDDNLEFMIDSNNNLVKINSGNHRFSISRILKLPSDELLSIAIISISL